MAEIKKLNSAVPMAGAGYMASAMDIVIEREQKRRRTWGLALLIRRYWLFMAAILVVLTILLQSIAIYAMQRSLADINTEIHNLQRSSETLRVTVLKAQNLDAAREEALAGAYVDRTGRPGIEVDLDFDNFAGADADVAAAPWWGKLFAIFQ